MKCGAKILSNDDITNNTKNNDLINKPSAFAASSLPKISFSEKDDNLGNSVNKKPAKNANKDFISAIKQKKVFIPCIIVFIVLCIAICIYIYYAEFTPEGKYNKAYNIYKELCLYKSSADNQNHFEVDDICINKLEEGKKLFEEAGNTKDAKLFYRCFKIASNLYRTYGDWSSSTTSVYLKQAATDIGDCVSDKLVPSSDIFIPDNDSQKLYIFLKGVGYNAVGVATKDGKSCSTALQYYNTLEDANGGSYSFCGKDTFENKQGLDYLSLYFA